jgi:hypothetical protein
MLDMQYMSYESYDHIDYITLHNDGYRLRVGLKCPWYLVSLFVCLYDIEYGKGEVD